MRIRKFSIIIALLFVTFTVRLGDFVAELIRGQPATLQPAVAMAEEKGGGEAKKEDSGKKDDKKDANDREEIPPKAGVSDKTEIKGVEPAAADPFAQEYTEEEIKVLQSLSKRREQIEQRERDLDQREKLLQAAEKKVDQKVVELEALKKNLEELLQNQSKLQDDRIMQLVKIYQNMKPKDAANIFNEMDFDVLLEIVDKMPERKVAPILAAMDPVRAREVSAKIAEQKALPKAANGQAGAASSQ